MSSSRLVVHAVLPLVAVLCACTEPTPPDRGTTYLQAAPLSSVILSPSVPAAPLSPPACPQPTPPADGWTRVRLPAGEGTIALPTEAVRTATRIPGDDGVVHTDPSLGAIAITYDGTVAVTAIPSFTFGGRLPIVAPLSRCDIVVAGRPATIHLDVSTGVIAEPGDPPVRPRRPVYVVTSAPSGRVVALSLPRLASFAPSDSAVVARFMSIVGGLAW